MSAMANLMAILHSTEFHGISTESISAIVDAAVQHCREEMEFHGIPRNSTESVEEKRRRKDRERKRVPSGNSAENVELKTGDILTSLSSSLLSEETLKKERKKESSGIRARDASAVPDDWPADYGDLFWQAYPRKEEKIAAMKKLATLRKSGIVTFADLIAGLKRYCSVDREPQFIKQPTVWLNKGCWADETQTGARNVERSDNKPKTGHDAIFAAFARKARALAGDSPVAGAAGEDEFPVGDGSDREPKDVSPGTFKRSSEAHDWRESFSLEGEIIPPNKATVGLPNGRERR